MDVFKPRGDVFLITDRGMAKRTPQSEFPVQGRYGKGVLAWKSGENIRLVGAVIGLSELRATALLKRAAARSVRIGDAVRRNRAAIGNPLFPVNENDQVIALTPVMPHPKLQSPTVKRKARTQPTTKSAPTKSRKTTTSSKASPSRGTKAKPQPRRQSTTNKTTTSRRKTSSSRSSSGSRRSKTSDIS